MPRNDLIQVRSDTSSNWTSVNPILATGEIGFATNTGKVKIGTGSTAWSSLPYTSNTTGTSTTADAWTTARTITLAGDLTGSVSIDGSANVSLNATIAANSVALGTDTTGNYMSGVSGTSPVSVTHTAGEGSSATVSLADGYGDTKNPYAAKSANFVLATPVAGGVPAFRAIVAADIPTLNQSTTGSSGSVAMFAATVNGWTGTGTDYDLYIGTTWLYGNTNLMFNNITRIELNNDGTTVNGALYVSGNMLASGSVTANNCAYAPMFTATGDEAQFVSDSTYTNIGDQCARVRNTTSVSGEYITGDTVKITSGGTLGVLNPSSRRFKENIVDYDYEASRLLSVNPVTFDFKDGILAEGENPFNHFGLIAEDLHDAGLTHLVKYDAEGQSRGIEYEMLSVELLGIVKKQQTVIDDLLARVQALETI